MRGEVGGAPPITDTAGTPPGRSADKLAPGLAMDVDLSPAPSWTPIGPTLAAGRGRGTANAGRTRPCPDPDITGRPTVSVGLISEIEGVYSVEKGKMRYEGSV